MTDYIETSIYAEISAERARQVDQWGEQNHPDGTGVKPGRPPLAPVARISTQLAARNGELTWLHILREEVAEAFDEHDPTGLRAELIQAAAVCVAWIEAIDRRSANDAPGS